MQENKRKNFVFTLIFNFYLHFINIITLLYIISWAQNDTPRAPWWPSLLMDRHTHTRTPTTPPHHHTRQDHTDTNKDTTGAPVLLINHTRTPGTWDRSTPNRTPAGAWWASGGGRGHICPAPRGVGRANRNDCGGESPMKE